MNRAVRKVAGTLRVPFAAACFILLSSLLAAAEPVAVHLCENGKARWPVVVSPQASPRFRAAATDLAACLSRITGTEFDVQTSDDPHGIAVVDIKLRVTGNPPFGDTEMYGLHSRNDGILIAAYTDLGIEDAISDFLHRLGYRQFFPGKAWEVFPHDADPIVALDVRTEPSYLSRRIWYGYGPIAEARESYEKWCARNRCVAGTELRTGHAYDGILARHRDEFAAHPEYLGLLDGKRSSTKFCISNPGLRKLVVADALQQFEKDPALQSVSVDPSDGGGWCECDECAKLGSVSDRAVTLANEVADAVAKLPGDKLVGMYAYNFHAPPPTIDVRENVVISIATAFIKGDYTVDQLMSGWQQQGATIGIREYLSVHPWDRDMPGDARGSNTEYVRTTIPHFHELGARFYSSEASDNWGSNGLGYYLASRILWDVNEAERADEIVDDFLTRCFPEAKEPMARFYRLTDGREHPLLSEDLVGRMYRLLDEAREETKDEGALARLDDLVAYTHYIELWRAYIEAEGTARQQAFEQLLRYGWRIRERSMIHLVGLWRDVPHRDKRVEVPPEAQWQVKADRNPWKQDPPVTRSELDRWLAEGIERNRLLDFEPVAFAGELQPASPLELASAVEGSFGSYSSGVQNYLVWIDAPPATLTLQVTAGLIYQNLGDTRVALFPAGEAESKSVAELRIAPDRQEHAVELKTTYLGLYRVEVSDRSAGTKIVWPKDLPITIESGTQTAPILGGRWSLYFYVPKGTNIVGGYATGPGQILDGDGKPIHELPSAAGYFSVPVPAGQGGQLWRFHHSSGQRRLMTVPPYLSRNADGLLLPREVIDRDK